jgi:hypothetical protein
MRGRSGFENEDRSGDRVFIASAPCAVGFRGPREAALNDRQPHGRPGSVGSTRAAFFVFASEAMSDRRRPALIAGCLPYPLTVSNMSATQTELDRITRKRNGRRDAQTVILSTYTELNGNRRNWYRLAYKQDVGGSNPSSPIPLPQRAVLRRLRLFCCLSPR